MFPFVAAAEDVQEEVELAGGREFGYFHWVMARRSSMPS
jgi:hypothetical protein